MIQDDTSGRAVRPDRAVPALLSIWWGQLPLSAKLLTPLTAVLVVVVAAQGAVGLTLAV